jgi:uncharacterized membrane protein HdeD (DUF308 family)
MINGKLKNIFGISSVIIGCVILPISFFPFSIPLIVIGSYFLLNGISNLLITLN